MCVEPTYPVTFVRQRRIASENLIHFYYKSPRHIYWMVEGFVCLLAVCVPCFSQFHHPTPQRYYLRQNFPTGQDNITIFLPTGTFNGQYHPNLVNKWHNAVTKDPEKASKFYPWKLGLAILWLSSFLKCMNESNRSIMLCMFCVKELWVSAYCYIPFSPLSCFLL